MSSQGMNFLESTPLGGKAQIQNIESLIISTITVLVIALNGIMSLYLWKQSFNTQVRCSTHAACTLL